MKNAWRILGLAAIVAATGAASGVPTITSLGGGVPQGVTNSLSGTIYISGSGLVTAGGARWTLTGGTLSGFDLGGTGGNYISADGAFQIGTILNNPQVSGNTATGVSPPFSTTPTLVSTPLAATESRGARWNSGTSSWQGLGGLPIVPSLMVYGSGSSGSSSSSFQTPNAISANGRFVVGLGYISGYSSSAGTAISNNTFNWRAWVWDANTNAFTILPTPFRTSSNTWRRRTGNPYAISNDGLVIVGAQEHNVGTTPTADPDGGRPVVWRWNAGTSQYDMSFLPNGVNGSGFPYTYSTTPGMYFMNPAGTTIVGKAADATGNLFIAKWLWNAGTNSWDAPLNLGSNLTTPATWLPTSVTSCGVPPTLTPSGMSEDGNTIVGTAVYSTCGSFMSGGFIWTAASGTITDWYDWNVAAGTPGIFANYGPIGDLGDPNRGLAKLGFPSAISADGNQVVGFQGGTQRIPGAAPWILQVSGGPACVGPTITLNPTTPTNFSACTSSIILNVAASGTQGFSYQWYKNGVALSDGSQPSGSNVTGATSFQLRVNSPLSPADAGTYYAVVSGECGSPAQSTNAVVQVDPAFPAASNDTCATPRVVTTGTNVLAPAQSPCGSFVDDPNNFSGCATAIKSDLWYQFTPSTTQNYRIETCGANYDTIVSLFDSCNGGELACNNDYSVGPSTGCTSARSRIGSIMLTAGTPYLIRIAAPSSAFLSTTSTANLSINPAPAPAPNDNCATATVAIVGANSLDTTESTNDGSSSCVTPLSRDVWFQYSPPGPGKLRLATCPGTTWNTVLSVHENFCYGTEIACNDNANVTGCSTQSIISNLRLQSGSTYYIRVGGNTTTAFGVGTLTLGFTCVADVDDGTNTGTPDGGVTIDDLLYYLAIFEAGVIAADVDDGSGTGTPDNGVTIDDLLYYLARFEAGC